LVNTRTIALNLDRHQRRDQVEAEVAPALGGVGGAEHADRERRQPHRARSPTAAARAANMSAKVRYRLTSTSTENAANSSTARSPCADRVVDRAAPSARQRRFIGEVIDDVRFEMLRPRLRPCPSRRAVRP
jgi:hypothetical protein